MDEVVGAAEVGCLESLGLAACCGMCCSCCCGDGSAEEAAEFGCLSCVIECLGCAACCRVACACCCSCCGKKAPPKQEPISGYAPLAGAPPQDVMVMAPGALAPATVAPYPCAEPALLPCEAAYRQGYSKPDLQYAPPQVYAGGPGPFPPQGYAQGYPPQGFVQQGYAPQGFPQQGYVQQGYVQQGYIPPQGYAQPMYAQPVYEQQEPAGAGMGEMAAAALAGAAAGALAEELIDEAFD